MKLVGKQIDGWPKLAWVASLEDGSDTLNVCHGPMVETADQWIVEAVWAGDFAAGNFDQTDLVFGTGIRCRGDSVIFVSSGTVFDRLWHCRNKNTFFTANSLPALLAMSELDFRTNYDHYSRDVMTIARGGLTERVGTIPTKTVDIDSTYYNNLILDQDGLKEIAKPDSAPSFKSFEDYYQYLADTAAKLGDNCRAHERTNKITPLSSISSGYDLCATATISRLAGCKQTATIRKSTSLWRGSDSGAPIAEQLGMSCTEYPRTAAYYPFGESSVGRRRSCGHPKLDAI